MSETATNKSARRCLDLSATAITTLTKTKVKNPYLKASKVECRNVAEEGSNATPTITPDAGIEKFFVSNRKVGDKKPPAARKLITPRENEVQLQDDDGQKCEEGHKRKSLAFSISSKDDTSGLYYHSDEESRANKTRKCSKLYEPGHIHSSLDYHHRGELPLDQGKLKAYRFIRNHFLIPCDIEADPKFGTYSGSSFEERVIRAYTLGQLEPKMSKQSASSLLVCSYCGEEGHRRYDCSDLL